VQLTKELIHCWFLFLFFLFFFFFFFCPLELGGDETGEVEDDGVDCCCSWASVFCFLLLGEGLETVGAFGVAGDEIDFLFFSSSSLLFDSMLGSMHTTFILFLQLFKER